MAKPSDLLPGTLDLLVQRTLELGPLHGVAIADRIAQVTWGVFVIGPGSLFPALAPRMARIFKLIERAT
jgi:PadR family transcriptional regulator PadR